jgi:hypothetical protein
MTWGWWEVAHTSEVDGRGRAEHNQPTNTTLKMNTQPNLEAFPTLQVISSIHRNSKDYSSIGVDELLSSKPD